MIEIYLRLLDWVLSPLLLLLGAILLLRGHDAPGGGFIAALIVSAAFALQILANGATAMRRRVGRALQPLIGFGILLAVGSALLGLFNGQGFFHGIWWTIDLGPIHYKIGTPVLFDFGVFMAVTGFAVSYLLGLSAGVLEAPRTPRLAGTVSAPASRAAAPAASAAPVVALADRKEPAA